MESGSWAAMVGDGASNMTAAHIWLSLLNSSSPPTRWGSSPSARGTAPEDQNRLIQEQAYRDFTTTLQVFILIGSLLGNATVLWCTCSTNVFKSVTNRFIKNLACTGICAGLACVPFDVALGSSPRCCWWLHTLLLCKAIKFLQKLFCSVTVLNFSAIALDRYYSVLYPLERKISDARARDLVIYIWVHAVLVSLPVFVLTNVTDVYVASSCTDDHGNSLGRTVYVFIYNITTVILPLALVFFFMLLIRRALSASQKKKVIIAALRTPQNSISIPYVSRREAELHASLLAVVLAFFACSTPYGAVVVYRTILVDAKELPVSLYLTALWLPKVSLLTNPLLFLIVNRLARHSCLELLSRIHRRYSRRNVVSTGGLASLGAEAVIGEPVGLETAGRSGSQLLEMFNIGQQQIFRPSEEEEEHVANEIPPQGKEGPKEDNKSGSRQKGLTTQVITKNDLLQGHGGGLAKECPPSTMASRSSPVHTCAYTSSSQVAPATLPETEDPTHFGFGPFELPPQWLPETRNSKKRLLPPLGNTPEELIQTKLPRPRPERRISRNNKVSTIPAVDP
ncbi:G-protein coupled receptor 176 [Dunckerocampus dactyliophorus]|uniref:G-protein coupled receptor 176 n=1 Tax=Dunckerocampus dactyliophorus TaxID=161453 RepID=UPI0024055EB6|nr:G-protein coupled receptor 176 [Dunckerocampus dactyliophorus]XP_054618609.1 G-protein coupled receptor 176 [Dunckerocampus dactyliophorus]XP_054618611.1 G-protein coupled receptor 176 [Dunckerocampus dactyliophorus]XP_054618612.1 G-protein coupled receptor 176 [Dunckerocampus dactyliophorus]